MVGDTHNDAASYSTRSSKAKPAAAADNRCTDHNPSTQATTKAPTRATNYQRNLSMRTATVGTGSRSPAGNPEHGDCCKALRSVDRQIERHLSIKGLHKNTDGAA